MRFAAQYALLTEAGVDFRLGILTSPDAFVRFGPRLFTRAGKDGGALAQSVEQRTENPCVVGSIPTGATTSSGSPAWHPRLLSKEPERMPFLFSNSCKKSRWGDDCHRF